MKSKTLIPAKCPQCEANVELDKNLETAFCSYCGTKIIIKDIVKKIKIVNNPSLENYLKLADRYYEQGEYKDALENYNSALKIEPDEWEAIYKRGICTTMNTTLGEFDIQASINGCKNSLDLYEKKEKDDKKIASQKINMASELANICDTFYNFAMTNYNEYWELENSWSEMAHRILAIRECALYAKEGLLDESTVKLCSKTNKNIETKEVEKSLMLLLILFDVTLCEVKKYKSGYNQYGDIYLNVSASQELRNILVKEYDVYVQELKSKYDPNYIPLEINRTGNVKGCYVATAVYGTYDCPEVWTLRRFRDFELEKSLIGKIFIKTYYLISPKIVKRFGNNEKFNKINKIILDKFVIKLNKKGYESTPYKDKY